MRPFLIWMFLFSIGSLMAQRYPTRTWSVEHGMSQVQVKAIHQDLQGNLWLGTYSGGINRFDGIQFQGFTEPRALSHSMVGEIAEDTLGRLYVEIIREGIFRFDGQHFQPLPGLKELPDFGRAILIPDPLRREVWLRTTDQRIWRVVEGGLEEVKLGEWQVKLQGSRPVFDGHGHAWIKTRSGFLEYEDGGIREQTLVFEGDTLSPGHTFGLPNGGVLFMVGEKVYQLKENLVTYTGMEFPTRVKGLFRDKEGNLWGPTGNGLWKFSEGELTRFTDLNGLPSNRINCVFQGREGHVWVGSDGGITRFSEKGFRHFESEQGVTKAYAITSEGLEDEIYFVTPGMLKVWDGVTIQDFLPGKLPAETAWHKLYVAKNGKVYIGTLGKGLVVWDGRKVRQIQHPDTPNRGWNQVWQIGENREGMIYAVTSSGGIALDGNRANAQPRFIPKVSPGRANQRLLLFDAEDTPWIGMAQLTNDTFSVPEPLLEECLVGMYVGVRDSFGHLWFSFHTDGIGSWDGKTFRRYGLEAGLTSEIYYTGTVDQQGRLWLASQSGLDRVTVNAEREILEVKHYGLGQGFTGVESLANSMFCDSQGRIWVTTTKGVTYFHPEDLTANLNPPRLTLLDLEIDFEPRAWRKYSVDTLATGKLPDYLSLPHHKNHLTFRFKGINFAFPEGVRYSYILEGQSTQWSPPTADDHATFTSIAPGEYVFKVKAMNGDGVWTAEEVSFPFEILTPFWNTTWFYLTVGALLSLLIYGIFFFRLRQTRKRAQLLRELQAYKFQALNAQMNPHFIFNSLNSIQNYILQSDEKSSIRYLSTFSKLIRQILDNTRELLVPFSDDLEALELYIKLEAMRFKGKVRYTLHTDPSFNQENFLVPPLLVQPFVENAIWHGLMNKEEPGHLELHFEWKEEELYCRIEDDGIGRAASMALRNPHSNHRSAGMSISENRLALVNRACKTDIRLEIHDLYGKDGHATGTRVEIWIPRIPELLTTNV